MLELAIGLILGGSIGVTVMCIMAVVSREERFEKTSINEPELRDKDGR